MNSRCLWPLPSHAANRCVAWGPFSPARYSASSGWEPPGPAGRTRAELSAGVPTRLSRINAWRPAGRATKTPASSAEAAGTTSVALRGRAVAAVIARIWPTTSTTAEAAAPLVPTLVPTRMARVFGESAFTYAPKALSIATGHAFPCIRIRTTAAPAETSAPHRPRTATGGHAVRFSASVVRRCAVVFAGRFSLTHKTAAGAEWFAVPARTALAVCANQRSRIGESDLGYGPCFCAILKKQAAGEALTVKNVPHRPGLAALIDNVRDDAFPQYGASHPPNSVSRPSLKSLQARARGGCDRRNSRGQRRWAEGIGRRRGCRRCR